MDDRLAKWFYEDNLLSRVDRLRGDVNLLQKLSTIPSVSMGVPPVPGVVKPPPEIFTAGLGIRLIQTGTSLEILRQGVDHAHGLTRWRSDGGAVFELPDVWDAVTWVTIRGVLEDPFMYSLSTNGTQLIFDDVVPQDWAIVALGEIRQV